jgi:hypothetical protein
MKESDTPIPFVEGEATELVQVTTYIREDQACALEMIRLAEQQYRGAACDLAELFQEALDMLINSRLIIADRRVGKSDKNEKLLEPK